MKRGGSRRPIGKETAALAMDGVVGRGGNVERNTKVWLVNNVAAGVRRRRMYNGGSSREISSGGMGKECGHEGVLSCAGHRSSN